MLRTPGNMQRERKRIIGTQNSGSQARLPKFEPELGHSIVPHHWANFLIKLCVNFLICKWGGAVTAPMLEDSNEFMKSIT